MRAVVAEPVSVETFAAHLSVKVLHCRELGHTWRPLVASWEASSRSFHRRLRCSSCATERVQVLNSRGGIVSSHYVYPEGYLAQHVTGSTGARDVYRLEAVLRTLDDAEAQRIRKAAS